MEKYININIYIITAVMLLCLTSCDEHEAAQPVDLLYHPGYIVGDDGRVYTTVEQLLQSNTKATAVIFSELIDEQRYLAVLLNTQESDAFCTTFVSTGVSNDITSYNGFTNTVAMQSVEGIDSVSVPGHKIYIECPIARKAFNIHAVGQSDYLPSVAELRYLYANKDKVNKVMSSLKDAGYKVDELSYNNVNEGWLWSSTEVEANPVNQAWLFSMFSGTIHETPKTQEHPSRLIMSYYPIINK